VTGQHGDGYDEERAAVGALFTEEGRRDPHGVLAALDLPTARFAVVERVLRDPAFVREGPHGEAPLWRMLARWLISLDGDRHRRLRQRFVRLFGPRTVERFREEITQRAKALLDVVGSDGHMDVVTDFARPLPFAVITGVMGVPESDRPVVEELLLTIHRAFAHQNDPEALARGNTAAEELQRRFGDLLDARAPASPRTTSSPPWPPTRPPAAKTGPNSWPTASSWSTPATRRPRASSRPAPTSYSRIRPNAIVSAPNRAGSPASSRRCCA
jgi:cytochrome P450